MLSDLLPLVSELSLSGSLVGTWVLLVLGYVLALLLVPRVLTEQRTAGAAWAWLLAFLTLPHLAVPA